MNHKVEDDVNIGSKYFEKKENVYDRPCLANSQWEFILTSYG